MTRETVSLFIKLDRQSRQTREPDDPETETDNVHSQTSNYKARQTVQKAVRTIWSAKETLEQTPYCRTESLSKRLSRQSKRQNEHLKMQIGLWIEESWWRLTNRKFFRSSCTEVSDPLLTSRQFLRIKKRRPLLRQVTLSVGREVLKLLQRFFSGEVDFKSKGSKRLRRGEWENMFLSVEIVFY